MLSIHKKFKCLICQFHNSLPFYNVGVIWKTVRNYERGVRSPLSQCSINSQHAAIENVAVSIMQNRKRKNLQNNK